MTSLALTHSALHNLAIPHIYSRFDIVWPDAHATTEPRTGVDALTYGLATLCMGADVFGHCSGQVFGHSFNCTSCGTKNLVNPYLQESLSETTIQRRLGNDYPRWTRKFSLGNGPPDWVQEYMITKESGKMLGTLVALAVARMINLETFVWDMPTGVLRDVWLALSSLQYRKRDRGDECRLERVWVRWHDNSDSTNGANPSPPQSATIPPGTTMTNTGLLIPGTFPTPQPASNNSNGIPSIPNSSQNRVEYPTLSVLPPLKSLSVLDIDELAYLDEMSILVAKSQHKLRELRVGIATRAMNKDFAIPWDGPNFQQVDHSAKWPSASTIGERRLGGVLGVLLGRTFDIRKKPKRKERSPPNPPPTFPGQPTAPTGLAGLVVPTGETTATNVTNGASLLAESSVSTIPPGVGINISSPIPTDVRSTSANEIALTSDGGGSQGSQSQVDIAEREQLRGQLKLQVSFLRLTQKTGVLSSGSLRISTLTCSILREIFGISFTKKITVSR